MSRHTARCDRQTSISSCHANRAIVVITCLFLSVCSPQRIVVFICVASAMWEFENISISMFSIFSTQLLLIAAPSPFAKHTFEPAPPHEFSMPTLVLQRSREWRSREVVTFHMFLTEPQPHSIGEGSVGPLFAAPLSPSWPVYPLIFIAVRFRLPLPRLPC